MLQLPDPHFVARRQVAQRKYAFAPGGLGFVDIAAPVPLIDSDAALGTLRKGLPVVADPDRLGIEIASYYAGIGSTEEAIRQYEQVLSRSPESEVAANNLAMLLVTYKNDRASLDRAKALTAVRPVPTNRST